MSSNEAQPALKRRLGLRDLTLFYMIAGLSLRWIPTAAAIGPAAITLWLIAWLTFFIPLCGCVLELSSRYPAEGGLYVWTNHAFGPFPAFLAGWCYWMSNLPYFPAVLYFAAGNLLYVVHRDGLKTSGVYYEVFSIVCLAAIAGLNIWGLNIGKWLNNAGAAGAWVPLIALMAMAVITWRKTGSATAFTVASLRPAGAMKDLLLWSTIAFAFGGCESASFMSEEIQRPRRNMPRALLLAGVLTTLGYLGGTVAMLIALPASRISGLDGFMQAATEMCRKSGFVVIVPILALLVALSNIGSASAYLSSTARLPFVAGLGAHLPRAFARIHPRFHTPHIAILVYGGASILCALMSQAGATVKAAYDVLVSLSILTYFIPYLFLFASMMRLQREPAGPEVLRIPGKGKGAAVLAITGIVTTTLTLVLSSIPADEDPNKPLTVLKTVGATAVLIVIGVLVYRASARRSSIAMGREPAA